MKRNHADIYKAIKKYQNGNRELNDNQFIAERVLIHAGSLGNTGGQSKINDANTLVKVGVSDFNGLQLPTDANGIVRAITVGYGGSHVEGTDPSTVAYKYVVDSEIPAAFLASELVIKYGGAEVLRMPIEQFMIAEKSDKTMDEWARDLMKFISIEGGKDFELWFHAAEGLTDPAQTEDRKPQPYFIKINLFTALLQSKKNVA